MLPGGIQDETSKHEHQKNHKRSISQTANAELLRPLSKTKEALRSRLRKHGLLTMTRRQAIDRMLCAIHNNIAWMTEVLHSAEDAQLCQPSFIQTLAAQKNNLTVFAAQIKKYKEKNKEHGTKQHIKRGMVQLADAVKHFDYLRKLLAFHRADG